MNPILDETRPTNESYRVTLTSFATGSEIRHGPKPLNGQARTSTKMHRMMISRSAQATRSLEMSGAVAILLSSRSTLVDTWSLMISLRLA